MSYDSCGCAGGETVTLIDEMDRRQKIYHDVLGRAVKQEVLNPAAQSYSVYATTVTSFNVRDQVTRVRQYSGTDTSATYQGTVMTYDGHGSLCLF